jgi:hypothetical protein
MDMKEILGTFDGYQMKVVRAVLFTGLIFGLAVGLLIGLSF